MAFLLPVLIATLAAASPLTQFVPKQTLPSVPEGWQFKAAAPADHKLNLHIRLKEENLGQLQKRALEISDPDHVDYGKHLTKAEVDALTAPTKDTVNAVEKWLSSYGVDTGKPNGGYLSITVSVDQAKKLLNADYGIYTEAATGRQTVRTTSYGLPHSVHEAIAMIQPTTLFSDLGISSKKPIVSANLSRPSSKGKAGDTSDCNTYGSSTDCLRKNYNVNGYTPSKGSSKLGITGFLGEVPDLNDLSLFLEKWDSSIPSNTTVDIISINNGPTAAGGEGEANLDTQITVPLAYPIESVFYSTGGEPPFTPVGNDTDNTNEPYFEWLQYTIGLDSPPQTYTSSYGDDERTVPADYADAVCTQFLKLGARGVSILVSSGDSGVGGSGVCKPGTSQIDKFLPAFPASCPWVTSVGGTNNYGAAEEAEHDGGGGFSNRFAQPDYQSAAVKAYITTLAGKFSGAYNASGRAYPDLSAAYNSYPVVNGGGNGYSGGTSASSPTVASIIALLNDYLISNGKAPLGFLNPFLYKNGQQGLRDIAKGHNNACRTVTALPAVKGWDGATGLGVPDFAKLKALL